MGGLARLREALVFHLEQLRLLLARAPRVGHGQWPQGELGAATARVRTARPRRSPQVWWLQGCRAERSRPGPCTATRATRGLPAGRGDQGMFWKLVIFSVLRVM